MSNCQQLKEGCHSITATNRRMITESTPNNQSCIFFNILPLTMYDYISPGEAIAFVNQGPSSNDIQQWSSSSFQIPTSGFYSVMVLIELSDPGTVVIKLNDTELSQTVMSTNKHNQIFATTTIKIDSNSLLSIVNPAASKTTLNIHQGSLMEPTLFVLIITRLD